MRFNIFIKGLVEELRSCPSVWPGIKQHSLVQSLPSLPPLLRAWDHHDGVGGPRRSPGPCFYPQYIPPPSLSDCALGLTAFLHGCDSAPRLQLPLHPVTPGTTSLLHLPQRSMEPATSWSCLASQEEKLTNIRSKPDLSGWTPNQMSDSIQYPTQLFTSTGWS